MAEAGLPPAKVPLLDAAVMMGTLVH